jgi:hypothetical protein
MRNEQNEVASVHVNKREHASYGSRHRRVIVTQNDQASHVGL